MDVNNKVITIMGIVWEWYETFSSVIVWCFKARKAEKKIQKIQKLHLFNKQFKENYLLTGNIV